MSHAIALSLLMLLCRTFQAYVVNCMPIGYFLLTLMASCALAGSDLLQNQLHASSEFW
jgi:hypothetical protein